MTTKHTPARLVPAALLLSVALMACNQQGTTPPADGVNALVLGPVQSPYFDALRPSLNVTQYTGTQKLDDYDMIVFDGDAQSPQTLKADPLVDQALRAGKWVLGLDVNEDHKRTGFGDRLGLVNRSTSPGWMVRMGRAAGGQPAVWVVDAPRVQTPLTATPLPGKMVPDPAAQLNASTSAYASTVLSRLRAPLAAPVADTPIPANLILKTYYFTHTTTHDASATYKTAGKQIASAQYNLTFNVYLDNSNNPQGNFQWVAVDADVTANPTSGTGQFANMVTAEKAWFLDRQTVSVKPSATDDAQFTSYGNSPATANGVSEVSTSTTFTVGFSGLSPAGSYTYSNQQTHSLLDWKLDNGSSGNAFSWNYRTGSPYDFDTGYHWPSGWENNGFLLGVPKQPNNISLTQLQLSTQGVWKTNSVLTKTVTFEVEGKQGLATVFCPGDLTFGNCDREFSKDSQDNIRVDVPYTDKFEINMASVVPIPISGITFSPANASAGTTVTGTITLASPAVEDTDITLISTDPQRASVLPRVTIKQGQSSVPFQVLTSSNGGAAGTTFGVTIQAFYAQYYQAQLVLKN